MEQITIPTTIRSGEVERPKTVFSSRSHLMKHDIILQIPRLRWWHLAALSHHGQDLGQTALKGRPKTQIAQSDWSSHSSICINRQNIEGVHQFVYLGTVVSLDGGTEFLVRGQCSLRAVIQDQPIENWKTIVTQKLETFINTCLCRPSVHSALENLPR